MRAVIYRVGVVISFLAIAGVAEAITGSGDHTISYMLFGLGVVLCLVGYTK